MTILTIEQKARAWASRRGAYLKSDSTFLPESTTLTRSQNDNERVSGAHGAHGQTGLGAVLCVFKQEPMRKDEATHKRPNTSGKSRAVTSLRAACPY